MNIRKVLQYCFMPLLAGMVSCDDKMEEPYFVGPIPTLRSCYFRVVDSQGKELLDEEHPENICDNTYVIFDDTIKVAYNQTSPNRHGLFIGSVKPNANTGKKSFAWLEYEGGGYVGKLVIVYGDRYSNDTILVDQDNREFILNGKHLGRDKFSENNPYLIVK